MRIYFCLAADLLFPRLRDTPYLFLEEAIDS